MRFAATLLSLALTGCSTLPDPEPKPAAMTVMFDLETIRPVVVEGIADREAARMVAANDPVRVASISKLVMAIAAFELAAEGKVDPEADISRYLGYAVRNPAFPDAPITLVQLLAHRSSLRDGAGYVIPLGDSLQAKLAEPEAWYPDAPPGEAPFEYANLGSPVVATVLEAASGERYDRLVERLVFAPLGIEACFNWIDCAPDFAARAVTLYRSTGEVARDDPRDRPPNCTFPVADGAACSLNDYVPGTNASIFSPQGGLRIGMVDLARLGRVWLKKYPENGLSELTYGEMLASMMDGSRETEFFCGYGAGVQMIEVPGHGCNETLVGDGVARIGHAGEAYGLRSGLWVDPLAGTGIAYFTTAVPVGESEDEGGFDPREIALVHRALRSEDETP